MKIGIIGATGQLGSIITPKLLEKNRDITLIVRNSNKVDHKNVMVLPQNLFDLTTEDINKFDVLIRVNGPDAGNQSESIDYVQHLIDIFSPVTHTR